MTAEREAENQARRAMPLDGVTVLDLSHALAGPVCTNMLADYGAKVIKIEPPSGDMSRYWGVPLSERESSYYAGLHRTKRGMVLDFKSSEGKALFFELVERADVVIENYRVGALKRLGIDYEEASKRNPGIIYCAISGFGQDGPYRDRAALDLILQAESGIISVTGEPNTTGTRCGVSIADLTAGMNSAFAIMVALREKERSGRGQFIDVPMLDGQMALLSTSLAHYLTSGDIPKPMGTAYSVVVPYQTFHTQTKDIAIAVAGDKIWNVFCPALGCEELMQDPRYATTESRMAHRDSLLPKLQEIFYTRSYEDWEALFLSRDIPVGAINDLAQVVDHPQVKARQILRDVHHPVAGKLRMVGSPFHLSETPALDPAPAPLLGQHTQEILREMLGLSTDRLNQLAGQGVFGAPS